MFTRKTLAAAALALAAPLSAHATFYSDSSAYLGASGVGVVATFENIAAPYDFAAYAPSQTPGATISSAGDGFIKDAGYCGGPSAHYLTYGSFIGPYTTTVSFDTSVNAVGFNIALDGGYCGNFPPNGASATINLFSGATLVDTETISGIAGLETFTTFFGFLGGPVTSLEIILSDYAVLSLDNLSFGSTQPSTNVPEPGTLGLIGLGLVALSSRRRKR